MKKEDMEKIIESHGRWIVGKNNGERANLSGVDLSGVDLSGVDLSGANLRWANLSGAGLRCAELRWANLRNADLRGANLRGANLSDVDLSDADLRNADLSDADLRGANLSGANLRDADLSEKILQVGPIGSRRDYTLYNATSNVVQCGCWNDGIGGTLEEFRERINEVYPEEKESTLKYRREYLAVIAYFETVRALEKEEQE